MANRQPASTSFDARTLARLGAKVAHPALLVFALAAAPTAALAQDRSFTEAAEAVINALVKGEDLAELDLFHGNYTHNAVKTAALEGCEPTLLEGSAQGRLWIDWTCPDPSKNIFTQIYFSGGELTKIDFQPMKTAMKPTAAGLEAGDLGDPHEINARFVDAVRAGEDPTLGGIIPVSDENLATLAEMKNWAAGEVDEEANSIKQYWVRRVRSEGDAASTTLFFDDYGRPIGLWVFEMQIMMTPVR